MIDKSYPARAAGGRARMALLSPEERRAQARAAAVARWSGEGKATAERRLAKMHKRLSRELRRLDQELPDGTDDLTVARPAMARRYLKIAIDYLAAEIETRRGKK